MKKFLLLFLLPFTTAAVFGQHYFQYNDYNTSSSLYEDANGFVGIGYAGADSRLHVFAGCDEQSVIMATIVPPSGNLCSSSLGDYFIANNVQLTLPEPTVRTDFIIKDGGQVGIGTATPVSDLTIHTHGYGTDQWGNIAFYVRDDHDDEHSLIAALLNTGTTDHASGSFLVNAYKDAVLPGLGLMDLEGQILAFGARGDGTIAMGLNVANSYQPDAQFTLLKYDPNNIHESIFNVAENLNTPIPFFRIGYNGHTGIGTTPSSSSVLTIVDPHADTHVDLMASNNHKSEIRFLDNGYGTGPRHVISDDNGDLLLDPKVSGAQGGNDRVKIAGDELVTGRVDFTGYLFQCSSTTYVHTLGDATLEGSKVEIGTNTWFHAQGAANFSGSKCEVDQNTWFHANGDASFSGSKLEVDQNTWFHAKNNATFDGKVNIGTCEITSGNHTDAKLFVEGKIAAKAAVVTLDHWCDYVFDSNYSLKSIKELGQFVKTKKHLPGIPSAKEVISEGNNLGEMDAKLLEKIEELSLYIIKLNEDNETLKARVNKLDNQLKK